MTATDGDDFKKQEFDDTTSCTYPRTLPCFDGVCIKCLHEDRLKTNTTPREEMPCPVCGRTFNVPPVVSRELPKNSFTQSLIQVVNVSVQFQSIAICDECVEENKEESHCKEIATADTFCAHCNQMFCKEFCRQHSQLKLTKNHKLMPVTEHESGQIVTPNPASSVCELHEQNVLNVYCTDCKTVVCPMCFIDDHSNHKGSHVTKFVDDFRKQIESRVEAINACRSKAETKKTELLKAKEDLQEKVENLEVDVEKRKDELKQLAEKHATSLLQCLYSIRESKLKEIEIASGNIDTYISSLETYNSYCQNIMTKATATDICLAFMNLSARETELQQQCKPIIEGAIKSFNFSLRKSELDEFVEDDDSANLIGEIIEESQSKPRRRRAQSLQTEQSNEIHRLKKEIESETTSRNNLILANEKLKIHIENEARAKKALTDELDKERANYDAQIKELEQESDNIEKACNTLEAENKMFKQELDSKNNRLLKELNKEKVINGSFRASNNKLAQDMNTCKATLRTLEDNIARLEQERKTVKTDNRNTILNLEERLKQDQTEKEELMILHSKEKRRLLAELRCKSDLTLVQTIKGRAADDSKRPISGLTILNNELFAIRDESSEVEVYDSIKFSLSRRWKLDELINPRDIVSCNSNKCLYIFNYKDHCDPNEILRVDPNGNLIKNWSTGGDWGWGLSVTDEANVILTVFNRHKLNEYSPDGQLICEIDLLDAGIRYPNHAIKLSTGDFLISHGSTKDDLHRVCVVDADGKLLKSFGGKRGSHHIGQLDVPVYLFVDGNGFVMVADQLNRRVLLLDPDLEFRKEVFPKDERNGSLVPWRILLDELNDRLFVADNESNNQRIFIFDFK